MNHEKSSTPTKDLKTGTIPCDKTAIDILILLDQKNQADFFHQLDSLRRSQYPDNDQDTAIFFDITPKLLNRFLRDLNKDQLIKTGKFEKVYYFNIAPAGYKDSKKCTDKISLRFSKETCSFHITIFNEFFAEWCQESTVSYIFQVKGNKISFLDRYETG